MSVGKSQRLKQAREEVGEEMVAYREECEGECKKQEEEARITANKIILLILLLLLLLL